jgi:hypothetical protein
MATYLLDGRAIDAIVALVAIEGCVLVTWRTLTGRGPAPAALVANLLAGASLLLALRAALSGASPTMISVCLMIALAAHGADIVGRWRSASSSPGARGPTVEASHTVSAP